ncbi:MAG TPA: tetratricopeptide repeat protein [Parvularculaceae bacterium]|nr:tetratricopeptide repeat protein [Parvularculaceae bacterium]
MTNDEAVLREVDQAVAEDQQWEFFRRNGPALIGAAAAIVLGVAGWQFWKARETSRENAAAVEFHTATDALQKNPQEGRKALAALAENAPGDYAALANLQIAASLAGAGDEAGALEAYRMVYRKDGAPHRLKAVARLRAAELSLANGRDAMLADLDGLTEDKGEFGYYARELAAVAALEAKDYQGAHDMFSKAAADPAAPPPIRQRAEELAALAAAGKAGVNLTGEAQVSDLLKALDAAKRTATPETEDGSGKDEAPPAKDAADKSPQGGGDASKDQ